MPSTCSAAMPSACARAEALLQPGVLAEDAAAADVLADDDDVRVGFHLACERERGRFGVAHQRHLPAPVDCTSVNALAASGQASAAARSSAAATSAAAAASIASSGCALPPASSR